MLQKHRGYQRFSVKVQILKVLQNAQLMVSSMDDLFFVSMVFSIACVWDQECLIPR